MELNAKNIVVKPLYSDHRANAPRAVVAQEKALSLLS